jgi:primosomal protein N' (replication factor Y)
MYAEIIIPLALPKNYTWSVPDHMKEQLLVGCRVEVNLGKNKKYAGIVKRIHNEKPDFFEAKDILNVLDVEPVVFEEQLKLWEWIASYYMCSEGEVMAAALPAHFKLSSETILVFNDEYGDDFSALDHDEYLVAEALLIKKELKLTEVQQVLDSSHVYPVINRLIQKKVCFVWEALKQTYAPKKENYVLLNPEFNSDEKLSELPEQLDKGTETNGAFAQLSSPGKNRSEVTKTSLLKKSNASESQLKGLVDKEILRVEKRVIDRLQYLPKT